MNSVLLRSKLLHVLFRIAVLKNFQKFTVKNLGWSLVLMKQKIAFSVFLQEFCGIFQNTFTNDLSGRMLLTGISQIKRMSGIYTGHISYLQESLKSYRKEMFNKITSVKYSLSSHENLCKGPLFLVKLPVWICKFSKNRTSLQIFTCEFC